MVQLTDLIHAPVFDAGNLLIPNKVQDVAEVSPEVGIFCHPTNNSKIRAAQMTLGAYLDLRGWDASEDDDRDAPGYLVERPDAGPPNHPDFNFFIAWVPKKALDDVYLKEKPRNFSKLEPVTRG